MADSGDRAREEFFSETQEIVEGFGRDLLALDEAQRAGRSDPELVNDIFRAVHTLKGLAGLFGASRISTLSHELEELLDDLRLGKVEMTAEILDVLFKSVELYSRLLQAEKEGRDAPGNDVDDLVRSMRRATGGSAPSPFGQYDLDPGLLAVLTEYEEHRLRTNIAQGMRLYRLRVVFALATIDQALDDLKGLAKPMGEIITYLPTGSGADADSIELDILIASRVTVDDLARALVGKGVAVEEIPRHGGGASIPAQSFQPSLAPPGDAGPDSIDAVVADVDASLVDVDPALAPSRIPAAQSLRSVAQTVRVDIHKLNRLMNIVGELAIVRTQLARLVERLRASQSDRSVTTDLHRLQRTFDRHLATMQQGILEVRMVPLGQVFDKLARVVRQISREAEKSVNLVITGAETEVDKLIVEELSDPLMHMMRNAIDHGIESKTDREAVGKPAVGTIALNAFQKGSHVVIEIEDDGRGVDTDTLLTVAMRRGVVSADEAPSLSPREILNLVFLPGLTDEVERERAVGARRRDGRREDEHREARRRHRPHERGRHRDQVHGDPADHARDHQRADGALLRPALRDPARERAGGRRARRRRGARDRRARDDHAAREHAAALLARAPVRSAAARGRGRRDGRRERGAVAARVLQPRRQLHGPVALGQRRAHRGEDAAAVHRRHERGHAAPRHRGGVAGRRAGRRHQGARPLAQGACAGSRGPRSSATSASPSSSTCRRSSRRPSPPTSAGAST